MTIQPFTIHVAQNFDWRAQEARLNHFAQFRADIDGFGITFVSC